MFLFVLPFSWNFCNLLLLACRQTGLCACTLAGLGVCTLAGLGVCTLAGLGACTLAGLGACTLAGLGVCMLAGPLTGQWLVDGGNSLQVTSPSSHILLSPSVSSFLTLLANTALRFLDILQFFLRGIATHLKIRKNVLMCGTVGYPSDMPSRWSENFPQNMTFG